MTQVLLPNTAHLFMVHQSLPIWLNDVVDWLSAKGRAAGPTRSACALHGLRGAVRALR